VTKKILIVLDTVRKQNMSVYGYEKDTTPFLEELAEKSTVYENAFSNSIWTPPSHASIFSGRPPHKHGTSTKNLQFTEESKVEEFREDGYETIGISNNLLISEALGFDKGFDEIHTSTQKIKFLNYGGKELADAIGELDQEKDLGTTTEKAKYILKKGIKKPSIIPQALKYRKNSKEKQQGKYTVELLEKKLEENKDQFFFLNFTDAHLPYNFSKKDAEALDYNYQKLQEHLSEIQKRRDEGIPVFSKFNEEKAEAAYNSSIRALDQILKEIFKLLEQQGEEFELIITSDHGEVMIEDIPLIGHHCIAQEHLISVPLIHYRSNLEEKNKDEDLIGLTQTLDLFSKERSEQSVINITYGGYSHLQRNQRSKEMADCELNERQQSLVKNEMKATVDIFSEEMATDNTTYHQDNY
jgi:arylsulfatase A-like enzyme